MNRLARPIIYGTRVHVRHGDAILAERGVSLPNRGIKEMMKGLPPLDGYIVLGSPTQDTPLLDQLIYHEGDMPEFKFYVYDVQLNAPRPFAFRQELVKSWGNSAGKWMEPIHHVRCITAQALDKYKGTMMLAGYPGVYAINADATYEEANKVFTNAAPGADGAAQPGNAKKEAGSV